MIRWELGIRRTRPYTTWKPRVTLDQSKMTMEWVKMMMMVLREKEVKRLHKFFIRVFSSLFFALWLAYALDNLIGTDRYWPGTPRKEEDLQNVKIFRYNWYFLTLRFENALIIEMMFILTSDSTLTSIRNEHWSLYYPGRLIIKTAYQQAGAIPRNTNSSVNKDIPYKLGHIHHILIHVFYVFKDSNAI